MNQFIKKYKHHLYILASIIAISLAYFPGILEGKTLPQGDIFQYKGAASEINQYKEKEDRNILWTNSQFGGMPTYQISGVASENPIQYLRIPKGPLPWDKLFLMLVCGYIMFISFGAKPWLALIGSIALSFSSGNIILIEAGHNTKALAVAYLPLLIAGMQYLLRKKRLLGFNLMMLGMALQLLVNHVQITYYAGIIIGIWMLFELYRHIKEKQIKDFGIAIGLALAGVILALGANSLNLMLSSEYAEVSIRGKSDLTMSQDAGREKPSEGLDYSYAFQWSNGWTDIPSLIIPNYAGGGSSTDLGSGSVFEDRLPQEAIENFPFAYYGALPFTSGPIYFGASVLLLFVLGMFLIKGKIRWWILSAVILSIALSMGKNAFIWLNDFFFYNVPLYNKFRAPTMALTIAQVCVPILAVLGLHQFFSIKQNDAKTLKHLKYTGLSIGGLVLILTFFSGVFTDHSHRMTDPASGEVLKDYDQEIYDQYKIEPSMLAEARVELIRKDGMRSLFFIAVVFAALWFYQKGKLKMNYALGIIGFMVLIDLWSVDKRYLNNENFIKKNRAENMTQPTEVDRAIMQDQSHYKVLDLQGNPLSNARTSYFHKSLGGYNAAKLRRYQELFDWRINSDMGSGSVLNSPSLNMLNTKYIIYDNQENGGLQYMPNPNALGNAWFVSGYRIVPNADSAIMAMKDFNPAETAIVEAKFAEQVKGLNIIPDSAASVRLSQYHPEKMEYEYNSKNEALIVFSEIYYAAGWNAYIDGKKTEYIQANYILRALRVPVGSHQIEFRFEPETYKKGKTISLAAGGLIYLILAASIFIGFKDRFKKAA